MTALNKLLLSVALSGCLGVMSWPAAAEKHEDFGAAANTGRVDVLKAEIETRLWQLGIRAKPNLTEKILILKQKPGFVPSEDLQKLEGLQAISKLPDTVGELSTRPELTEIDPTTPEEEQQSIREGALERFEEQQRLSIEKELLDIVQ